MEFPDERSFSATGDFILQESSPHKLLDETRAREIRDVFRRSNASAFKRIIDKFDNDLTKFATALQSYVEGSPVDDIKRMAHSLKGASQTLGAQAVGELFIDMELLAGMGDVAAVERCHAESRLLIEQSLAALRQLDLAP